MLIAGAGSVIVGPLKACFDGAVASVHVVDLMNLPLDSFINDMALMKYWLQPRVGLDPMVVKGRVGPGSIPLLGFLLTYVSNLPQEEFDFGSLATHLLEERQFFISLFEHEAVNAGLTLPRFMRLMDCIVDGAYAFGDPEGLCVQFSHFVVPDVGVSKFVEEVVSCDLQVSSAGSGAEQGCGRLDDFEAPCALLAETVGGNSITQGGCSPDVTSVNASVDGYCYLHLIRSKEIFPEVVSRLGSFPTVESLLCCPANWFVPWDWFGRFFFVRKGDCLHVVNGQHDCGFRVDLAFMSVVGLSDGADSSSLREFVKQMRVELFDLSGCVPMESRFLVGGFALSTSRVERSVVTSPHLTIHVVSSARLRFGMPYGNIGDEVIVNTVQDGFFVHCKRVHMNAVGHFEFSVNGLNYHGWIHCDEGGVLHGTVV